MFRTAEDCERREYINSNPRYRGFCQTYFTAGDEEQFEETRDRLPVVKITELTSVYSFSVWSGYKDISSHHVLNTFRYIFNKFKKGIFISIKNNKVETFLPFSKAKFINEWSDQIQFDPKFGDRLAFFKYIAHSEGRVFNENKINKITSRWYGNNCLVRCEFPQSENDTGVHHIKSMIEDVCERRHVPDMEFFVNRRDFPLLKKDGTEPYDDMWDSHSKPLLSHHYDKYAPILSSTTTEAFADIAIPTIDDWARVKFGEGFYFPKTHRRDYNDSFETAWEDKKPIAVFRGASTGRGTTIETNPRLKVAYLSSLKKVDDSDTLLYLDAGITDWNIRPRKVFGEKYLQTIEIEKLPFGLIGKLTPEEQSHYKYIIHIDGHSAAFRLSLEMSMKSVILKVDSEYTLWFAHLIKPYEHYIPVKADLSDLYEKIEWCKQHDKECKRISENAYVFYKTSLSKDGILDYIQSLLFSLRKDIAYSYPKDPLEVQIEEYKNTLNFSENIERGSVIVNNKLSTVHKSGDKIVKHTKDPKKIKENIHEAFIGLNCVNQVTRYTPHFAKIHGITREYDLISEYISDSETFFSWLGGTRFNFDDYISILYQLGVGLHIAQQVCEFVHGDLFPWNILLTKSGGAYACVLEKDLVVSVNASKKPVIIDYGKSRVVYNNKCYEFISSIQFSRIYDIFCVLFSSLNVILRAKQIRKERDADFLKLVNFISDTGFCGGKFTNFIQARQFVFDNSSFSSMLVLELKDLKNVTPLDFCRYLYTTFPSVGKVVKLHKSLSFENNKYEKKSEKEIMKKINKCVWIDKLFVYYFFQQLSYYISEGMMPSVVDILREKLKHTRFSATYSAQVCYTTCLVMTYKGPFELTNEDRQELNTK